VAYWLFSVNITLTLMLTPIPNPKSIFTESSELGPPVIKNSAIIGQYADPQSVVAMANGIVIICS